MPRKRRTKVNEQVISDQPASDVRNRPAKTSSNSTRLYLAVTIAAIVGIIILMRLYGVQRRDPKPSDSLSSISTPSSPPSSELPLRNAAQAKDKYEFHAVDTDGQIKVCDDFLSAEEVTSLLSLPSLSQPDSWVDYIYIYIMYIGLLGLFRVLLACWICIFYLHSVSWEGTSYRQT